ncbi:hypothetical protein BDV12DRAFT_94203 [Aspergillus spectabilis]
MNGMLPWLDQPVMLHSDRDPGECTMTAEQCAYKSGYWVNWYQADHRYALPTVAFFLVAIALFTIGHLAAVLTPRRLKRTAAWSRLTAVFRFLSYRNWRIWQWNTQSLGGLLLAAAGVVFFLAMTLGPHPYYWPNTREISFGNSPPIATRAGFMALACLPFLFALGAKANPITALTGISSEKLNVWHNWVAWAMYVLALVHTFPFIVFHIWRGDIVMEWNMGGVWVTGVVALLAQTWLTFMSIPWIRNRYYEFFKAGHYIAALVFIIFFFFHCDFRMSSWDYFIATAVLYTLCWAYAQCKTYFEHGVQHKARLFRETDHTLKIAIETNMTWYPGQHMFIRFLTGGIHRLTMHPFTICSVSAVGAKNTLVFYVRPRGGITGRLMKMAEKQAGIEVPVLLGGPYGGLPAHRSMALFDRSIVIGGGAGAGPTLSMVEDLLRRGATGGKVGSQMSVVLATRDPEMRTWYCEALKEIEERYSKAYSLSEKPVQIKIAIYETRVPTSTALSEAPVLSMGGGGASKEAGVRLESNNDSTTTSSSKRSELFNIKFSRGRPDLRGEIERSVCDGAVSSLGIVVCGPSSMSHDVSAAAAETQQLVFGGRIAAKDVFLHQESFTY